MIPLSLLATGGTGSPVTAASLALSSSINVVFDGNSITNDHLASGLDVLVAERLGAELNGATTSTGGGLGVNGQTWIGMRTSSADLNAAWVVGKTNVLVCAETINSIWTGRTAAQTIADATAYLAMAAAQHPWIILLWGSTPAGHGDETTYPGEAALNAAMMEVDAHMAANWADMGAHGWVDVRAGAPMFDHDGTDSTQFTAYQSAWAESPPSGWTHPKDGTFPSGNTPGTGKRAIAAAIAAALTDGRLPAAP